jgi:hypothetical protein
MLPLLSVDPRSTTPLHFYFNRLVGRACLCSTCGVNAYGVLTMMLGMFRSLSMLLKAVTSLAMSC